MALFLVLIAILAASRNENSSEGIAADLSITAPFENPPTKHGSLCLAGKKLRVDFGPVSDVYDANQKKGWRMYRESKQYSNIGEKQVSLWLPPMTVGSPCPKAQFPDSCKMVGKEKIAGRPSTHWRTSNQHGVPVDFWTDDRLQIAVKWHIENVVYELSNIHDARLHESLFELPSDYVPVAAN